MEENKVEPNNRLFVGNLPFKTTSDDLRTMFGQVEGAEVTDAVIVMDNNGRFGPRSKGYGFVTLGTTEMAEKAIQQLNGSEIEGRKIAVDFAKPKRQDSAPSGGEMPQAA